MRTAAITRLSRIMLACMLALAPMPLLAAVYKCEHNGQVTYSDAPCGKNEQRLKSQVVVVPSSSRPDVPAEKHSSRAKGLLSSLGLDTRSGVIGALLFGIPLSFLVIFFLTRKSEN